MFPMTETFDRRTVAKLKFSTFLAHLALRVWPLARILHAVGSRIRLPQQVAQAQILNHKYALLANVIPDDPEDTGYTRDHEVMAFFNYRSQLTDEHRMNITESPALYEKVVSVVSELITSSEKIKSVFNFGVAYAHVDSILAGRFQNIQFVGIDRSPFIKALNEVEFSGVQNLRFVSGDVFEHLSHNPYPNGLFLHSRTASCLNRPIIEDLYEKAFEAGFEFIAGFEQFGLSRTTLSPFTFSLRETDSVGFRSFMFIHNYPGLLLKAGYRVEKFEIFKTRHPHPDLRMAAFIARRDPGVRPSL